MEQKTRFDRILARVKGNPLVASAILVGTIIIALSTFTDAVKNLLSLHKPAAIDISGKWHATVHNQFGHSYGIDFTFEVMDDRLLGTVVYPTGEGGIFEGKITGDRVSFITRHIPQFETEEATIRFEGKISRDQILFLMQTESGHSKFTAARAAGEEDN